MQTLIFNTTTKTVKLYEGNEKSEILYSFSNISTVKVGDDNGFYELIQKNDDEKRYPVARFPIAATNMLIYT